MKKIIFLFLIALSAITLVQAQNLPVDPATKKVTYKGEANVSAAVKKPAVFNKAKSWAAAKGYKEKEARKDLGVYVATGEIKVQYPSATKGVTDNGKVTYTLTITAADGKFQYVITDFQHFGANEKKHGGPLEAAKPKAGIYILPQASWNKIKEQTDTEIQKVIKDLKAGMAANPAPAK